MATIRIDANNVLTALADVETKTQVAIRMYAQEGAKNMEGYAKTHRRWQDRTGHARQRLVGWVETLKDKTRIYIGHGVSYGIYLELGHEKRYAILKETVNQISPQILKGFQDLLKHLR